MKTGDTTKSSSAFFSKLQEDVTITKKTKRPAADKPKHSAKKFKL